MSGSVRGTWFDSREPVMFQRDYISRIIEEMSDIPARVMDSRLSGKVERAWEQIHAFYATYPKFKPPHLLDLTPAEILGSFAPGNILELEPVAALLCEEGELLLLQDKKEAFRRWKKALEYLDFVNEHDSQTYSGERVERIRVLKEKLCG